MHYSHFVRALAASGASAAIILCSALPAAADHDSKSSRHSATAAPKAAERAPVQRTYSAPAPRPVERTYSAPAPRPVERTYSAPRAYSAPHPVVHTYSAPRPVAHTYTAPSARHQIISAPSTRMIAPIRYQRVQQQTAPRHFVQTMPVRRSVQIAPSQHFVQIAPRQRSAQIAPRQHFVQILPRQRSVEVAPRGQFMQTAPRQHFVQTAPFVERVRVAPRVTTFRQTRTPFEQIVQLTPHRETRFTAQRAVVTSPLMRAVFTPRERGEVAYRPAYLTGRVVSANRDYVVLQPPFGSRIEVRDVAVVDPRVMVPVGRYVAVPVTYSNGYYSLYPSASYTDYAPPYAYPSYAYPSYAYPSYAYPSYAYPSYTYPSYAYGSPAYCGSPSSVLYAAALPAIIGAISGNGSLSTSDLAALALTAAASSGSCSVYPSGYTTYPVTYGTAYPPVYNSYPATYTNYPVTYNSYPDSYNTYPGAYNTYATPYDNCAWTDDDNDDSYCAASPYYGYDSYGYSPYGGPFSGYGNYGAYGLQQIQGLVVAKTGSMLMVLGGNGMQPIFVDASPAFQSGYAVNGPVAPGQLIDAYGFYNGNTFVATALM